MINGSRLASSDILGALVERPAGAGSFAILEQVRDIGSHHSKGALITSAAAQMSPSDPAAALTDLCPLVATSGLTDHRKSEILDEVAGLMRQVSGSNDDAARRRRMLVLGIGELLRNVAQDRAPGLLEPALRRALVAAARRGSIVGFANEVPDAA